MFTAKNAKNEADIFNRKITEREEKLLESEILKASSKGLYSITISKSNFKDINSVVNYLYNIGYRTDEIQFNQETQEYENIRIRWG
jgi:hypothetical protein